MSDMKWYVVHTYSGMEKSAESALRERIAREGLQDYFEEIFGSDRGHLRGEKRQKTRFHPPHVLGLHLRQNDYERRDLAILSKIQLELRAFSAGQCK